MATVAEIEQQLAALRARLGALEDAKITVQAEIERLQFQAVDLRSAARRQREGGDIAGADALRAQAQALDDRAAGLYNSQAFRDVDAAESEIRRLENELYNAQQKAKFEAYQEKQPPATTERTAQQKAESDQTTPVVDKPAPVSPEGGGDANAAPTAENPQQTQQKVAQDDKPPISNTTTQQNTNTQGNLDSSGTIKPQANILDRFASNTWSASVYLLSPAQYTALVRTKKKNVNGYNLLFQSGGAPNNVGGYQGASNPGYQAKTTAEGGNQTVAPGVPGSTGPDAGRNPAFAQDFYIDSISFENALPGKQTQTAHMISNLKFTVIEPGNITLLDRIYAAVQDMAQTTSSKSKNVNYTATQYLMVIRWYGYDINGNLMQVGAADPETGLSDPNAVVEKFIPFMIRKVNWSVSNKLVSYEFDCAPVGQIVGGGTRRGTIPYDVELTSRTVGDLLAGSIMYYSGGPGSGAPGSSTTTTGTAQSTGGSGMQGNSERMTTQTPIQQSAMYASSAPKADAAPAKNILKQGLAGAMTEYSAQLVTDKKVYQVADVYEVVFADGAEDIKNAVITLPGDITTQTSTPMGVAPSANANQAISPNTNPMNTSARKSSITAGMQMTQVIDLAIRNSSYIYSQALTVYDNEQKKQVPNPDATGKPVQWFNITFQAVPLEYDESRNDFAYKITYIISKYEIPNFESSYFPVGKFRGIHKRYPYWFTGENTAVLDYTASFNAAYNMTISGGPGQESADAKLKKRVTSNGRDIVKYTYAPRSTESNKGADGLSNEIGANAAEYLYAYADPGGTKLKIIGDPAWIQQGSLAGGVDASSLSVQPFLPDGTINFDNSQVLFEIAWQRPEDYDLTTGLANPYARPGNTPGQPVQTNFYQATKVSNEFRGGKFEQTITGVLYFLTLPDVKKADSSAAISAAMAAAGGTSASQPEDDSSNRAEDAKFARQGNRMSSTTSGSAVLAGDGAAKVTSQMTTAQSAMNQASAEFVTGTPLAPVFSNPNYSQAAISGSTFAAAGVTPADTIAPARYPQAPTGSGVGPVIVSGANPVTALAGIPVITSNAPLPLNTTLYNVSQRIQNMAKDS